MGSEMFVVLMQPFMVFWPTTRDDMLDPADNQIRTKPWSSREPGQLGAFFDADDGPREGFGIAACGLGVEHV